MILKAENIKKSYKKNTILNGINLEVHSGQITGIIGSNGCGKTTLLSILVGLSGADEGTVTIDGRKIGSYAVSDAIGYVPQINPLPGDVRVKDCLNLWCADKDTYEFIVARYNLAGFIDRRIDKLSGGMKRRTAIACAMASRPGILIMDEPTAALDITYKQIIHNDMVEYVKAGGAILMVTHEADEIAMCNICYRMENGILRIYDPIT